MTWFPFLDQGVPWAAEAATVVLLEHGPLPFKQSSCKKQVFKDEGKQLVYNFSFLPGSLPHPL